MKDIKKAERRTYYIGETVNIVAAAFSAARGCNLQAAGFEYLQNGIQNLFVGGFFCQVAYDLIASPGQFQSVPGYALVTGLSSGNEFFARSNATGANSGALSFPFAVYHHALDFYLGNIPSLSFSFVMQPGTGVAAAGIQSMQIAWQVRIDQYLATI